MMSGGRLLIQYQFRIRQRPYTLILAIPVCCKSDIITPVNIRIKTSAAAESFFKPIGPKSLEGADSQTVRVPRGYKSVA